MKSKIQKQRLLIGLIKGRKVLPLMDTAISNSGRYPLVFTEPINGFQISLVYDQTAKENAVVILLKKDVLKKNESGRITRVGKIKK